MIIRVIFLGIVLMLSACSTTGKIDPTMPITGDLDSYDSIFVAVTSELQVENEELLEIEELLIEQLVEEHCYSEVSSCRSAPDKKRDLTLQVKVLKMPVGGIQDYTIFSEGETRFDVILIAEASGKTIGACIVSAEAWGGGIWSTSSGRAIDCAVEEVVMFVTPD